MAQHVLIVGGGLAGPALAVSLARIGIRSTVFEIRQVKGDSGGSITLAPNALRALDKSCGVYNAIRSAGYVYDKLDAYLDDGYKLGELLLGDDEYPAVRIMRTAIHKVLLDACEAGGVKIVWGARLTRIEEGEGVTAHFEDGSSASGESLVMLSAHPRRYPHRRRWHPLQGPPARPRFFCPYSDLFRLVHGQWLLS